MEVTLEAARAKYWAAHEAYRVCAARVAVVVASGDTPSDQDVKAEQQALSELNAARQRLFEALARRS